MKLTIVLTLIACLQVAARGNAQTVSISGRNLTLEMIFKEIRKQAGYEFVYKTNMLDKARTVDIDVRNSTVEKVLEICFANQPFTYTIIDKTIVVKEKSTMDIQSTGISPNDKSNLRNEPTPPIDVHGRVTNENGEPVAGASVKIKGTNIGTSTNDNGEFVLNVPPPDMVLVISGVNIETKEVPLNARTSVAVSVKMKNTRLNEVVINKGYYTEKQILSTSSVGIVKAKEIEKQPVANPLLALEGRIPGLFITQNTGIAGGGVTVRIQGQNSLSMGNDPLYVIDGVPYPSQNLPNISGPFGILGDNGNTSPTQSGGGNPLSFINPTDIESIEILKDADATSIYGSRAAAGAILITTKKGQAGKTKIDLNISNGWGRVTRMLDLLNTQQYLQMRHEAKSNDNAPILTSDYDLNGAWDTTRNTNWQKELIGNTAHRLDGQLSVSGGNANTQFLISSGYHRETTVFPTKFSDEKISTHFSISHFSTNQKFDLRFSGGYLVDNNQLPNTDLTDISLRLAPVAPPLYNSNGSLNWAPLQNGNSSWYNPLAFLENKYAINTYNLVSNVLIHYKIFNDLEIQGNFGYTNLQQNETSILPSTANAPELRPSFSRASFFGNGKTESYTLEPQINYKRNIAKGELDALVGTTFLRTTNDLQQLFASGFSSDEVMKDIAAASNISVNNSISSKYSYNALFGRINYEWQNKYVINLTARRDGSSRFGSQNLFHNFASAGAAWIFSNLPLIQKNWSFLSLGKFRVNYGTTGNDQIGDYQFMNLYSQLNYPTNYQGATGLAPSGLSNPFLQWEETRKLQFGVDLVFFRNRINVSATYYRNRSSNQLLYYSLPIVAGFNSVQTNLPATIQNNGTELIVHTINVQKKNFVWQSDFNLTIPKNKLISYPSLEQSNYADFYIIGQPIPFSRGYHNQGVDPATGLFVFLDSKGNKTSSPVTPDDLTILNIGFPHLFGGLLNSITYKGFELSFLFQFVKQDAPNYSLGNNPGRFISGRFSFGPFVANQPTSILDGWQKPGDNSSFQKYSSTYPTDVSTAYYSALSSDRVFSDASFIRLKNIYLSWQMPASWINRIHFQSAKVYLSGQNILTITKYIGLDPESKSVTNLPPLKVWTCGIQITL